MSSLDRLFSELEQAGSILEKYSQEQIDKIVYSVVKAGEKHSNRLSEMAVDETGFGIVADKITKNSLATTVLWDSIKNVKTVGIIKEDIEKNIIEVAVPVGIVVAVIPSTNPTSTALFKAIIALKGRNPILFSPHPSAKGCISETVNVIKEGLKNAGAPLSAVEILSNPTIELTNEAMRHPKTALILATGGLGLVKAAYSSGKPAYGVGPGNVPVFIERTAEVVKAVKDVLTGKAFDNGTICASEQAIVVDKPIANKVLDALKENGGYVLSGDELDKVSKLVVTEKFTPNPKIVGKSAVYIAGKAGITVPDNTRALIAPLAGVGKDYPLSIEKLSPILAFYIDDGWQKACERCIKLLKFGGLGHSMGIHSRDMGVIKEFALHKPAFRILVNSPTTFGAVGYTTNLNPSLTLGCGTFGNNITSENVTAKHMINIKRVAFETNPVNAGELPPLRLSGSSIKSIIEEKISAKFDGVEVSSTSGSAVDFVSEDDVINAKAKGIKIYINDNTMITPLAKDTGKEYNIFLKVQ